MDSNATEDCGRILDRNGEEAALKEMASEYRKAYGHVPPKGWKAMMRRTAVPVLERRLSSISSEWAGRETVLLNEIDGLEDDICDLEDIPHSDRSSDFQPEPNTIPNNR